MNSRHRRDLAARHSSSHLTGHRTACRVPEDAGAGAADAAEEERQT